MGVSLNVSQLGTYFTNRLTTRFVDKPLPSGLLQIAGFTLYSKVVFFIVMYVAFHTLPFSEGTMNANFKYESDPQSFSTTLKTWDGQHYQAISEFGYLHDNASTAFYPLYPALIEVLSPVFGHNHIFSGVFISLVCSFLAFIFFYLFFKHELDQSAAFWATLLMISFPTAFYTNILYSEALFLCLTAALFWASARNNYFILFGAALLLPLSRPQGVLLALPFFIYLFNSYQWRIGAFLRSGKWLSLLFFACGLALYFTIIYFETGSAKSGLDAQKHFISGNSLSNLFHPVDWFKTNVLGVDYEVHGFKNSAIDRLFFVLFIVSSLLVAVKIKNKGLFVYMLVLGGLPVLAGSFMSYSRYTLLLFPMFMAIAAVLKKNTLYFILASMPIQVLFAVRHCLNYWQA